MAGNVDTVNGVLAEVSAYICGREKSTITTDEQKALVQDFRSHLSHNSREVDWDDVASCLLYPASVLKKLKKPTDHIKAVSERAMTGWSRGGLSRTTQKQLNHYKRLAKDKTSFGAVCCTRSKETDTYKWAKEALKKAGIYGKLR